MQYDQGRYDNALASLAQAVVLDPKNSAMVHHYLGVTIGQKRLGIRAAEDEMRKALQTRPGELRREAHFNLAGLLPPAQPQSGGLETGPPATTSARLELGYRSRPGRGKEPHSAQAR